MVRRALVPAILVLLGLSGCRERSVRTVAVVPKGATQTFWQTVHAGAVKAAREFHLDLAWNAPALESDRSRQIAIVDSMINLGVSGIALAPVDRAALVNVVDRAIGRGIPVVVFDSGLDSSRPISFIATDNREGGRMAARRMGEVLRGKGKVVILDDMPGSASTTARVAGFQEECWAKYPGIEILPVQFANSDRAKARALTENLMTANPDLAGIFADHENAAIGAALALASRQSHSIKLVAFDVSEQLVQYLKEGVVDSLVVQNPFRMGYETVRALAMKINGQSPAAKIDTGSTLVRVDDLNKPEIKNLIAPDLKPWQEP